MTNRTLGLVGLVCSPGLFLMAVANGFDPAVSTRAGAVFGFVFLVGWACSLVGLRSVRGTGAGPAGAVLLALQLVGLALAATQQVYDFVYVHPAYTPFYRICDMAWPISVLFMIVPGVFALAARRLAGWRRWTPLLCGIGLPLLIGLMPLAGKHVAEGAFSAWTAVTWALLAWAVRTTTAEAPAGARAPDTGAMEVA